MSSSDENTLQDQNIVELVTNDTFELLPAKSRDQYERVYNTFINWRKNKNIESFSENTVLLYFSELSKTCRSSTLWSKYSMLRLTLNTKHNIDISQYVKVKALLKRMATGYKAKKSKMYSFENVQEFLNKAPDNKYLAIKTALIFGITGACGTDELHSIKVTHIEDTGSLAIVKLPRSKTWLSRTFVIQGEFYEIYKKYSALRPSNAKFPNFFLNYQYGTCTQQVIGVNNFGSMPSKIAAFLDLPNPKEYTGHSFRCTSASFLQRPPKSSGKVSLKSKENEVQFMIENGRERKNICRACLTEESAFQSVFQTENNSGLLLRISDMMSACATIRVTEGDGLPDQICSKCAKATVEMYLFKIKCEKSDRILKERLKNNSLRYEENSISQGQIIDNFVTKIKVEPDQNEKIYENKVIKEFEFDICQERLSLENLLKGHELTHAIKTEELEIKEEEPFETNNIFNDDTLFDPPINNESFERFAFPEKQEPINSREKPYECDKCKKKYSRLADFIKHLRIHMGEKPYECKICKKKFSCSSKLACHKRIHTGKKPHECDVCEKKFIDLAGIVRHKRIHTGEKPYECEVCQKKFSLSSNLNCHRRIHTGAKPYECETCKKKVSSLSALIRHRRIHTGVKPYECDTCKKKFSESANLMKHIRVHTGEKPYECDICKKKFSLSCTLICHKRIHTGEKPYECDMCKEKFSRAFALKKHKIIHLEKEGTINY